MKIAKMLVPCFGSLSIVGFIDNALVDNGVIGYNGRWVSMQQAPNNTDNQQIRLAFLRQDEEQGIRNGLAGKTMMAFNIDYIGDHDNADVTPWELDSVPSTNCMENHASTYMTESESEVNYTGNYDASAQESNGNPTSNIKYVEIENYNASTYTTWEHQTFIGNMESYGCESVEPHVPDINFFEDYSSIVDYSVKNKEARQQMNNWVNDIFPNGKNEDELNGRYGKFNFYHFSTNEEVILMVQSPKMDNSITAIFDENGWLVHIRKITIDGGMFVNADYFYRIFSFSGQLFFLNDTEMCRFKDKWIPAE